MKNRLVLFTVFVLAIAVTCCNTKAKQARACHDKIMEVMQTVIDSSLDFTDAVQRYDKTAATYAHANYSGLVERAMEAVEKKGNFKDDTTLLSFAKEMLLFYRGTLNNNFKPFLVSVKSNSFSAKEKITADSLVTDLTMNENLYWSRFDWAEKKFYKEHELEKTEK